MGSSAESTYGSFLTPSEKSIAVFSAGRSRETKKPIPLQIDFIHTSQTSLLASIRQSLPFQFVRYLTHCQSDLNARRIRRRSVAIEWLAIMYRTEFVSVGSAFASIHQVHIAPELADDLFKAFEGLSSDTQASQCRSVASGNDESGSRCAN